MNELNKRMKRKEERYEMKYGYILGMNDMYKSMG